MWWYVLAQHLGGRGRRISVPELETPYQKATHIYKIPMNAVLFRSNNGNSHNGNTVVLPPTAYS